MPLSSRLLFSFVAIATILGAHIADFSATHIFNDAWTGHAKYHTGHTMAATIVLGGLILAFAWRKTDEAWTNLLATTALSGAYWISQAAAILYPNTTFFDPEVYIPANHILGVPSQLLFQIVFLSVTALAAWLGWRALNRQALRAVTA